MTCKFVNTPYTLIFVPRRKGLYSVLALVAAYARGYMICGRKLCPARLCRYLSEKLKNKSILSFGLLDYEISISPQVSIVQSTWSLIFTGSQNCRLNSTSFQPIPTDAFEISSGPGMFKYFCSLLLPWMSTIKRGHMSLFFIYSLVILVTCLCVPIRKVLFIFINANCIDLVTFYETINRLLCTRDNLFVLFEFGWQL